MLPPLSCAGVNFRAALSETAKETAMASSRIDALGQPKPRRGLLVLVGFRTRLSVQS
jgi:hypothetical protein